MSSTSSVRFHKAQSLSRCSLFCTWWILLTRLPSMLCLFMRMLMTHSYMALKSCHPSNYLNTATWTLIDHWMSANRLKLNGNKTQLLFASSSHICATLSGKFSVLQLGADIVVACSHVRLLGVDISYDLSLDHHVPHNCVGCYYRLCQLRHIRRSLDSNSLATLVYTVVNSQIDYCNTLLAGVHQGQ